MKVMKWIVVIVMVVVPTLSFAEFYKYVDENGKVRFTDNLANVPDGQRPQVKEYEEASHELAPKEKAEEQQEPTSKKTKQGTDVVNDEKDGLTEIDNKDLKGEELEKKGEILQQVFEALMEERQELDKAAKVRLAPGARKKLVEKISDFNLRIKDYEEKRRAYNKVVEAHNTEVEKARPSEGE